MPQGYQAKLFGYNCASGVMAAGLAANSEIIQVRIVDTAAQRRFRVVSAILSAAVDTVGFTAGIARFDLVPARAWTAAGTGGGTLTLTGNNGKMRTLQQAAQNAGEIRVATTAALTAGTKTLDAQGIAGVAVGASTAAGSQLLLPTELIQAGLTSQEEPLIVSHNEGFVIRANVPAVGTWGFNLSLLLAEADL